jgi:predicted SprT family Zn-dependent metalloprotease
MKTATTIDRKSPTREYVTLSAAFDHFNTALFGGALPPVLITMQRRSQTLGYFAAKRFESRAGAPRETDEIALNPACFPGRSDEDILGTLVHEMVHHWQYAFGTPSRGRYHNHEWADKMDEVGLTPTNTGFPGGRRTGQRVMHLIVPGGPFAAACRKLLRGGTRLAWQSREPRASERARNSKTKYTCPACGLNAWAKPEAHLVCGACAADLRSEG